MGLRVIIPESLRGRILDELHNKHPGISRMKSLARIHAWYPKMNADIEKKVQICEQCEKMSSIPKSVPPHPWDWPTSPMGLAHLTHGIGPPHPWDWPTKPMERIHLDFFGPFYEHQCLTLMDAYSGWIEAEVVKNMNSSATINLIDKWVSRYGIPIQIVTDNGTQFISVQFIRTYETK